MLAQGSTPIRQGVLIALVAAVLFGVVAPIVQWASADAGALASGALLYLGAAGAATVGRLIKGRSDREAPLRKQQVLPLLAVALVGGLAAPWLLVMGLQRMNGATATLLLALEAPFTFLLARAVYGEFLGRRALLALTFVGAGAAVVALGDDGSMLSLVGVAFVLGATAMWGLDNTVSRSLADREPLSVVAGKGWIGGGLAFVVALAIGQRFPDLGNVLVLLIVGAFGFGVSLQLYLRAQRIVGAGRTASVFSSGPFIGAGVALLWGAPYPGWSLPVASVLMFVGVWLHATETHGHAHEHRPVSHEHVHSHDDGHHGHSHGQHGHSHGQRHGSVPEEAHSHWHEHEPMSHDHEHGEDLHHRHPHKRRR